jgi:hypothetical protein
MARSAAGKPTSCVSVEPWRVTCASKAKSQQTDDLVFADADTDMTCGWWTPALTR